MFILVDGNNFYVSCERVGNPSLIGKPVVVLSNNDGCAISRSDEAKALGIEMGKPLFKIKEMDIPVTYLSSNYAMYGDMSSRMADIIGMYAPEVEVYSIDECFGRMHGVLDYEAKCREMRQRILKWIGIPTGVGIAPTKSLAKVANKIAKKFPERTGSVYCIDSEEKRIKALEWLKVGDVWGIGKQNAAKLKKHGIHTAYEFTTKVSAEWVKKNLSIVGYRLQRDLMGYPTLDFEDVKPKKAIACTRAFEKKQLANLPYIEERVRAYASNVSAKLRLQKSHASCVQVFIQGDYAHRNLPGFNIGLISATDYPTNSTFEIIKTAMKILRAIHKDDFEIAKAGVVVSGLTPADSFQTTFFGHESPKDIKAMEAIDFLNLKYGRNTIKFGGQDLKREFKQRQDHLSRNYASNINELIEVH